MPIVTQQNNVSGLINSLIDRTRIAELGRQRAVSQVNQLPLLISGQFIDSLERARQRRFQASQSSKARKQQRITQGIGLGASVIGGGISGGILGSLPNGLSTAQGIGLGIGGGLTGQPFGGVGASGINSLFNLEGGSVKDAAGLLQRNINTTGTDVELGVPAGLKESGNVTVPTESTSGAKIQSPKASGSTAITPTNIEEQANRLKQVGQKRLKSGDVDGALALVDMLTQSGLV